MSCHLPGLVETLNSIQFSCFSRVWLLWPHGLRQARPPCPSPAPGVYPNSYPLSWWCHPTTSSSVIPFSSCLQSFPASGSFPMSQFFTSGGQSIGVSASASVLPVNLQDWFPSSAGLKNRKTPPGGSQISFRSRFCFIGIIFYVLKISTCLGLFVT